MRRALTLLLALLATLPAVAGKRFIPWSTASSESLPPYYSDLHEWWDGRTADFSTTGAGKLLDTWTGRVNSKTLSGSGLTRPVLVSDTADNSVRFTTDYLIAGTFTSDTFQDGEIVIQATPGRLSARAVANGTQSSGANLRVIDFNLDRYPDNSTTWVGQTSGAVFTPSGYPVLQTATNYLQMDATFAWDRQARTLFVVMNRDVTLTSTVVLWSMTGDTDREYFAGGEQIHWNGTAELDLADNYIGTNRIALYSAANGSTDITIGMGPESDTFAYRLNPSGTATSGRMGSTDSGGQYLTGSLVWGVLAYDRYLNSTERNAVLDWITTKYKATSRSANTYINFTGDSIVYGTQSSDRAQTSWPAAMARLCTYQPKYSNRGISGASIYPSAGDVISSSVTDTDFARNAWATNKVLVVSAGTNDITVNGRSSAQIITDLTNYITARKAATSGLIVIAGTIINKASFSGAQNTIKDAVNAAIIAGTCGNDDYIDFQSLADLADPTDTDFFSTDQAHPNDAGYAVMAAAAYAKLQSLGYAP